MDSLVHGYSLAFRLRNVLNCCIFAWHKDRCGRQGGSQSWRRVIFCREKGEMAGIILLCSAHMDQMSQAGTVVRVGEEYDFVDFHREMSMLHAYR